MFNSFHIDGVKAFDENNYGIAKDFFLQAIGINPEVAESYLYLGKCFFTECLAQYGHHLYNKDYKKAQETYLEAMHLDPEHLIVINQLGMSLFKQDCFPAARKYFSSILEKTEDKQEIADAWLNIACTYRLEKKWVNAEAALSKAKQFAPEDSSITEEEMKLNESKLAALLVSTPQTLFGSSNPDSQGAGLKTVPESNFHFGFN